MYVVEVRKRLGAEYFKMAVELHVYITQVATVLVLIIRQRFVTLPYRMIAIVKDRKNIFQVELFRLTTVYDDFLITVTGSKNVIYRSGGLFVLRRLIFF